MKNMNALYRACQSGDLHKCQNLIKSRSDYQNGTTFGFVCETGRLELAKWMAGQWPRINIHGCNNKAFRDACIRGDLDMAKWFSDHDKFKFTTNQYHNLFCEVSGAGHLDVLQWMVGRFASTTTNDDWLYTSIEFESFRAVISAIAAKRPQIIAYFNKNNIMYPDYIFAWILSFACENNDFDMVYYCRDKCPTLGAPRLNILCRVCHSNYIKMIKYIVENFYNGVLLQSDVHHILRDLDINVDIDDCMDVIEFLLSLIDDKQIYYYINNYYMLRCRRIIFVLINYFDIDVNQIQVNKEYQEQFNDDIAKAGATNNKSARKICV